MHLWRQLRTVPLHIISEQSSVLQVLSENIPPFLLCIYNVILLKHPFLRFQYIYAIYSLLSNERIHLKCAIRLLVVSPPSQTHQGEGCLGWGSVEYNCTTHVANIVYTKNIGTVHQQLEYAVCSMNVGIVSPN